MGSKLEIPIFNAVGNHEISDPDSRRLYEEYFGRTYFQILYRKELEESSDPDKFTREKVQEFRDKFANPFIAAERGYIDEIIEPQETRPKLIRALEMTANKRDTNPPKKHGNIPL